MSVLSCLCSRLIAKQSFSDVLWKRRGNAEGAILAFYIRSRPFAVLHALQTFTMAVFMLGTLMSSRTLKLSQEDLNV